MKLEVKKQPNQTHKTKSRKKGNDLVSRNIHEKVGEILRETIGCYNYLHELINGLPIHCLFS